MKADLITLHSVYNYGSVLQTYATEKIFWKHGVKVTTINYYRPSNTFVNRLRRGAANSFIKEIILLPSLLKQKRVFDSFCKRRLNITSEKYIYENDFDNYISDADFYITGSDQVWNSTWNDGILKPFYLSFVKDRPKIAFAASFGKETIKEKEVNATKKYIQDYIKISVRENSAVNILKNQYNYDNVVQILDPTLLLTKDEWIDISQKEIIEKNYILVYQLNSDKKFDEFVEKLAKSNNKKIIRICRRYDQIFLNGKSKIIPTVENFISLFANAELVVTDSFHAISFSLNLNTPFVCIYPKRFSTRLQSCLEMFELLDRKVENYNDFDWFNKKIDWTKINEKLAIERKKADDYIDKCIELIKKNGGENDDMR